MIWEILFKIGVWLVLIQFFATPVILLALELWCSRTRGK